MNQAKHPGVVPNESIRSGIDKRLCDNMIKFMGKIHGPIADIGEKNDKCDYISSIYGATPTQVTCEDFNYPTFHGKYRTVFCFEILEHVQNPLLFMAEVSNLLDTNGVLFLATPSRFRFLWGSHHFFEMDKNHIEKWICTPLDLKIIRSRKIRIKPNISIMDFIGIRPLLRLPFKLFSHTIIYEIRKL